MKDHNGNTNNMIANIYGMHLGVNIYCKDDVDCETTGKLVAVRNGVKEYSIRVKYTDANDGRWYKLKDCKLLLKPLSSITEEDKREFEKTFKFSYEVSGFKYFQNELWIIAGTERTETTETEKLWVRSRGYDIPDGLVPDEYKEVRG